MLPILRRHWFLVALLVLIPGGIALGLAFGENATSLGQAVEPRWVTAAALFLMSFTLDSSQLRRSVASPGPVILATLINFGFIPLLALAIAPMQLIRDFEYGILIAASAPCTMAAASVWTRQAGGNDAVSLLVTIVTNSVCVVVTPFWLQLGTSADVDLGFGEMSSRLLVAVLIPGLLGQLLRLSRPVREFAVKRKSRISMAAMACILVLVLVSSTECGLQLSTDGPVPGFAAIALVWISCVALHLMAMQVAVWISRLMGMSDFDRPAIAFASSQKTLPIGVMLARELATAANVPFAVFPMLMFHASQLIIDTAIANRMSHSTKAVPDGGADDCNSDPRPSQGGKNSTAER